MLGACRDLERVLSILSDFDSPDVVEGKYEDEDEEEVEDDYSDYPGKHNSPADFYVRQ